MPNVLEAEGCEPGSHDGLQTQLGVAPAQFFELSALPITLSALRRLQGSGRLQH